MTSDDDSSPTRAYGFDGPTVLLGPEALKNLWTVLKKHFPPPKDATDLKDRRRVKGSQGKPGSRSRLTLDDMDEFIDSGDLKGLLNSVEISIEQTYKSPVSNADVRRAVVIEIERGDHPDIEITGEREWRLSLRAEIEQFLRQNRNHALRKRVGVVVAGMVVTTAAVFRFLYTQAPLFAALILSVLFGVMIVALVWPATESSFPKCRVYTDKDAGKEPLWYRQLESIVVAVVIGVVTTLIVTWFI